MTWATWRVGTKLGRTLYRDNVCVGMVDTPELAAAIVQAMNALAEGRAFWNAVDEDHPLRAEVERLRAKHDECNDCELIDSLKLKLAAANALLAQWASEYADSSIICGKTKAYLASAQPAACDHAGELAIDRATGEESCSDCQPAAPDERAFYDGSCLKCGSAPVGGDHLCHDCRPALPARSEAEHAAGCRYEQEFPALDPEDCPRCAQAIEALREGTAEALRLHERTEAEQAVLDAMAAVTIRQDGDGHCTIPGIEWEEPLRAELARRGLT